MWLLHRAVYLFGALVTTTALMLSPPRVEIRRAGATDVYGMSRTLKDAFGSDRLLWALALARRFDAMRTGDLSPHALLVARLNGQVVGVTEVGLLPAPPSIKGVPSKITHANALWRGVPINQTQCFANDVPTIANVAVASEFRRLSIGRRLVQEALHVAKDWGPDLYARVTDPNVLPFWRNLGFNVIVSGDDVRGRTGTWLAIPLRPKSDED